jgi:hypothetical protein
MEDVYIGQAVQKCSYEGVVLDYKYHKGCNQEGTVLGDSEYPFIVNAFAEHKKWTTKAKELDYQEEDAEGNAFWTMEDKFRSAQVYHVCCHYVVEYEMCEELKAVRCDLISRHYADYISLASETVLHYT